MDEPGDLETLERQVSLLQDLLGNLQRRREVRRRRAGSSAQTPPMANPTEPAASSLPQARAQLRLVRQPGFPASPAEPNRRPHFREKRRWDLSGSAPHQVETDDEISPRPDDTEDDRIEAQGAEDAGVSWQVYRQLLSQRDELLLQLSHHQASEARLMEERAAGERKDQEIRALQEKLRHHEASGLRDLLGHLQRRLQTSEEFEERLIERAMGPQKPPQAAAGSAPRQGSGRGTLLAVRGCQMELCSAQEPGGPVYAFAVLTDLSGGAPHRKGFHALASSERAAELACVDRALQYLDTGTSTASRVSATREVLRIHGRQIELLCDAAEDGTYRAFPLLHEGGCRKVLMRFHVQEAITASTAGEARRLCIRRLEELFDGRPPRAGTSDA